MVVSSCCDQRIDNVHHDHHVACHYYAAHQPIPLISDHIRASAYYLEIYGCEGDARNKRASSVTSALRVPGPTPRLHIIDIDH
jgi:hypothetical protein